VVRAEAAAETRRQILVAAHQLFVDRGYDAMTMQAIAERAGVALDTVYAAVGNKPLLARLLVETAISNMDHALPAEQREYVQRIRAAPDARLKLAIYAAATVDIHGRLAPLVRALQAAASRHSELAEIWRGISERRARNMRLFAANLISTGQTRRGLDNARIADIVWALAAPDMYLLLVEQRGWSAADFEAWLLDTWVRLLLDPG
jgi:AcrR family transcriptional regulator